MTTSRVGTHNVTVARDSQGYLHTDDSGLMCKAKRLDQDADRVFGRPFTRNYRDPVGEIATWNALLTDTLRDAPTTTHKETAP